MEGDLRDEQWELIAPLLPTHKKRGRPRADDRRTLNGILWVLRFKDLCRREGIRPSAFYAWTKEFMERGRSA